MRMATRTILAIFMTALTAAAGAQQCSAQNLDAQNANGPAAGSARSGQTTGMASALPAPVGHRQPTMNDLPDSLRDHEYGRGRAAIDPLGPLPKLCNGC